MKIGFGWLPALNLPNSFRGNSLLTHFSKLASLWRASLGLIAVAIFAAGCAVFIYFQYSEVRRQSTEIQTRVFRDSIAVFNDLWHVEHILQRVAESEGPSQDDLYEFSQYVDFLYVRTQGLASSAASDPTAAIVVNDVVKKLLGFVENADAALANELANPREFYASVRPDIDELGKAVINLTDLHYFKQKNAIVAQISVIKRLSFTSMALLGLFGTFGACLFYLLQRQLRIRAGQKEAESKANFLAFFDSLTGLPNRDRFRRSAQKLIDEDGDPVVFLFDLDDFKLVNDVHGHHAGDAVLHRCAECIDAWCRERGGTPARLGGDEFAAVLPGPMSSMKIASICEILLSEITKPFEFENAQLSPRMSIGVAASWSLDVEKASDLEALQKAADVALYRAKELGKNTYAFFDNDLAEIATRRRDIEIGIDEALANDGFSLAYQPQVDMQSGDIKGFEALARWVRNGEVVSPGEFISVAESTGQVVEIDLWGMRQATLQIANWIRQGFAPVTISANLSPLHFRSDDIVNHVRSALVKSGLPPHLLTLEITESVLIEDLSKVTATLEKLRALGVKIALDDFGTGYSSLAYLRRLDVDYIKIDQSFVRDLEQSSETQLILDALVNIAKGLKKMLVVEGVETDVQAEIIRSLGCDIGQGYLWGKPMPRDEAQALLKNVDALLEDLKIS